MAIGKMNISIGADGSLQQTTSQIKQAFQNTAKDIDSVFANSLKGVGDKANGETTKIKKGLDEVGTSAMKTGDSLNNLGQMAAGLATLFGVDKIVQFGKEIITVAGNLEQAQVAFTTMLGSADAADKMLTNLSNFAMKTPFQLEGIRDTAKQLLAFGIPAENMMSTLKKLGDVSAGVGAPIQDIARAFGEVNVAGKLTGVQLRMFTNQGVNVLEELGKMYGKSAGEVRKMAEEGKVSFADVSKAFDNMTSAGGRFYNLMDKQSKTLQGTFSNLQDNVTRLESNFGTLFIPTLTSIVNAITPIIGEIGKRVTLNPGFAMTIGIVIAAFTGLLSVMGALGFIMPILTAGAVALSIPISGLLLAFGGGIAILTGFAVAVSAVSNYFADIPDSIDKMKLDELNDKLKKINQAMDDLDQQLINGKISVEDYKKKMAELRQEQDNTNKAITDASKAAFDLDDALAQVAKAKMANNALEYKVLKDKLLTDAEAALKLANAYLMVYQMANLSSVGGVKVGTAAIPGVNIGLDLGAQKQVQATKLQAVINDPNKAINDMIKQLSSGGSTSAAAAAKAKALTDIAALAEFNRQQYAMAIDDINRSKQTDKEKSDARIAIYKDFIDKQRTLEMTHIEEIADQNKKLSVNEKQFIKDRVDQYKKSFADIDTALKTSEGKIDDYRKAIQKVADDFKTLREKAIADIADINISLKSLSEDYGTKQADRYAELTKEMAALEGSTDPYDMIQRNRLDSERQFILTQTTEEQRKQAALTANMTQAEKDAQVYEKEKLALLEKQNIATAISKEKFSIDKTTGKATIDSTIRIGAGGTAQYMDEKQQWIDITDAKNQQYALDALNKQNQMIQDLSDIKTKVDYEIQLQTDLHIKKTEMEQAFSTFVQDQTNIQRAAIGLLISDVDAATARINAMNGLKVSSEKKGFMAGGYTGNGGIGQEAGIVHGQEYVISNPMLQSLPGIIPALESVRNGGSYDYSKNINIPAINVKGGSFDLVEAFEKIKFRL